MPDIDAAHFRQVLGHFPTGVTVITAVGAEGRPGGFAVGSFFSISLDPPQPAYAARDDREADALRGFSHGRSTAALRSAERSAAM